MKNVTATNQQWKLLSNLIIAVGQGFFMPTYIKNIPIYKNGSKFVP